MEIINGLFEGGKGLWHIVGIEQGAGCNTHGALGRCGSHQVKPQVVDGLHYGNVVRRTTVRLTWGVGQHR